MDIGIDIETDLGQNLSQTTSFQFLWHFRVIQMNRRSFEAIQQLSLVSLDGEDEFLIGWIVHDLWDKGG